MSDDIVKVGSFFFFFFDIVAQNCEEDCEPG